MDTAIQKMTTAQHLAILENIRRGLQYMSEVKNHFQMFAASHTSHGFFMSDALFLISFNLNTRP